MKEWIECSLEDATHVEINGKVWTLSNIGKVAKNLLSDRFFGGIRVQVGMNDWTLIHQDLFCFLGIKCLKQKERVPMEFELTFEKKSWNHCPTEAIGKRFRCIEILKEEE